MSVRLARWCGGWPIRTYLVLLLAVVLATAGVAVWLVEAQTSKDSRNAAYDDAQFATRTASEQLGQYIALVRASVAQLAANPQIGKTFSQPAGCTLSFSGLGGQDKSHLDIIAPDGKVACSSRPAGGARASYAGAAWLSGALARPQLAAPTVDPVAGVDAAVVSTPIGRGRGVVAGFVDLDAVGPALAKLYSGGHPDEFLITSANGRRVIARSLDPKRWVDRRVENAAFAGASTRFERNDLDGVSRLYAQATVPGTDWHFYAGEKTSAALAASARLARRELAIVAVGLLVVLLAGWIVHGSIVRPLRRLRRNVRSMRTSSVPIAERGPAELRELAAEINALASSVQHELGVRLQAEDDLARSERNYRLLFESNPSPMWVYEVETWRFVAVNEAAVQNYGFTREEFLAMTIEDIRPPEEVSRLRSTLGSSSGQDPRGLNSVGVWTHRRKDGSLIDVEVISQDHLFNGRTARVVLAVDVTQRVAAEHALRRSEARYRDLFENATDMIATVDIAGRFTAVNAAFANTLGYDRDELIGRPLAELVPDEWHSVLADAREDKLDNDRSATVYKHDLRARDGHTVPVEVASRVIVEDGRPIGIEAICRDLSEREQLEEQLRQAQRLESIGRLAGGVAHDFNNLLTVISGYTEALLGGAEGGEVELNEIAAAAERATALTQQLLAFSRRQVLQPRVLNLNDVISGITPMLARLIGEDVELLTALDPQSGNIVADPDQIEQVLLNLAVNARDAMPAGGQLTISTGLTELDDTYVEQHAEARPGRARRALGERHGHGHGQADDRPDLRAVLHDETRRRRAPDSASRPSTESSSKREARSGPTASRGTGRRSRSTSRPPQKLQSRSA